MSEGKQDWPDGDWRKGFDGPTVYWIIEENEAGSGYWRAKNCSPYRTEQEALDVTEVDSMFERLRVVPFARFSTWKRPKNGDMGSVQ